MCCGVSGNVYAEDTAFPILQAECAVLMDGDSGEVLFSKDPDKPHGMASTTKIMTALVALELYDPEAVVTVRPQWTQIEGSSIYLKPGEQVTVQTLLYGLLLESGNDAAEALAGMHPEGKPGFVHAMNAKASALGLTSTHFANPSGLDEEDHYTTARELALLACDAMKEPVFSRIVETKEIEMDARCFRNHNKLLWRMEGCVGVKTGYTKAAGRILVSAARRGGRGLICVTIRDPNDWEDHLALMDAGFAQYEQKILAQAGQPLQQRLAARPLICQSDLSWPVLPGEKLQYSYDPTGAFPSAYRGSAAGRVLGYVGDRLVGAVEVCWG